MPKGKKKATEVIEVKAEVAAESATTENSVIENSANITSELQNVELTHNEEWDVTGAEVTEEETQTGEELTTTWVATEAEQVVAETAEATEWLTTINTAEALDAKKEAEAGEETKGEEGEENKETQPTVATTNSDWSVVYTKNWTSTRVDTNPFGRKTISYEPIINKEEAVIKAKIVLGKRGETRIRPDWTEYIR